MKAWLRKVALGFKVAEQVAVIAGEHGFRIKDINPAELDAAARIGAKAVIAAVKKPKLVPPEPPPAA